ncbi:MAG: hypothetical protein N2690_02315 [Rhodocyclaceae bacterium]|nr:hypothetical protein [Rhodocyclaceae bacterium]
MQQSLFPVQLKCENAASGTRDLRWIGTDHAGVRYALRTRDDPQPLAPMTEWLCYHLCQHCGIYQPGFAVVQRTSGELAFGSVWVEDAWQYLLTDHTQMMLEAWLRESASDVSAMLALDAFLPNSDRHIRNILLRRVNGRVRAMAMDWSDVRLTGGTWPWPSGSNSAQTLEYLRSIGAWRAATAAQVLHRLKNLTADAVMSVALAAPEAWRDNLDMNALRLWWTEEAGPQLDATASLLELRP